MGASVRAVPPTLAFVPLLQGSLMGTHPDSGASTGHLASLRCLTYLVHTPGYCVGDLPSQITLR